MSCGQQYQGIDKYGDVTCEIDDTGNNEWERPEIGSNTANYVSKWNGSALVQDQYLITAILVRTATPNEQIEITGNLRLPATTATTGIIKSESTTLIHTYGLANFFAGLNAGNLTMTGSGNAASGSLALVSNTTGSNNSAGGAYALKTNNTAQQFSQRICGALFQHHRLQQHSQRKANALLQHHR